MGRTRYVTALADAIQFGGVFFVSGCLRHPIGGFAPDKIITLPYFLGFCPFCHGSGDFILGKILKMPQAHPRWQVRRRTRSGPQVGLT